MVCLNLSSRSQPIPAIHSQEKSDGVSNANELSPRYLSTRAWETVLRTVGRSSHISKRSCL